MFQCPKCKDAENGNLRIHHLVRCASDVNNDESVADYEVGDLEWDDKDEAECLDCGWSGKVQQISVEEFEEESA